MSVYWADGAAAMVRTVRSLVQVNVDDVDDVIADPSDLEQVEVTLPVNDHDIMLQEANSDACKRLRLQTRHDDLGQLFLV